MTAEAPEVQTQSRSWYAYWLPRLIVVILVGLAVFWGASWIFVSTTDFIITLILAFFVAFAMLPAVDYLSNKRGWRRGLASSRA